MVVVKGILEVVGQAVNPATTMVALKKRLRLIGL